MSDYFEYSRDATSQELYLGKGSTVMESIPKSQCCNVDGVPKKWIHLPNPQKPDKVFKYKLVR